MVTKRNGRLAIDQTASRPAAALSEELSIVRIDWVWPGFQHQPFSLRFFDDDDHDHAGRPPSIYRRSGREQVEDGQKGGGKTTRARTTPPAGPRLLCAVWGCSVPAGA